MSGKHPRALFVQSCSLSESGGGSRILTSMIEGQPFEKLSLNAGTRGGMPLGWIEEKHLPLRPNLRRLDRGRLARIGYALEVVAEPFFEKRLAREMERWQPDVVHIIPHWVCDFHVAWKVARAQGRRVVMSVNDDLSYLLPPFHPLREKALRLLSRIWQDADHVFSISTELGNEYGSRYGQRPFEIITDGLAIIPEKPAPAVPDRLNVYFMGLFHYDYRENLRALTCALATFQTAHPEIKVGLTMRCETLEKQIDSAFPAQVLRFASQDTVLKDMTQADLLYMPLPFGAEYEQFTRFSLSTKMVSYLGSGVPIFFHGPPESAAARLLERHQAALTCHSLDISEILAVLKSVSDEKLRANCVENALSLARTNFQLEQLRATFRRGLFP